MQDRPLRVLLVEDNEDDYYLTQARLAELGPGRYELDWAADYDAAVERMRKGAHDVCLLDHHLGRKTGLDILRQASELGFRAPIIILTGRDAQEVDLEAMRAGAADFLVKDQISTPLLERAIRYAVERARDLEALRQSEQRYALAVKGTNEGLWDWDLEAGEVYYSPRWKAMLGCDPDEVGSSPEEWMGRVHADDLAALRAAIDAHLEGKSPWFENEHRILHKGNGYRWMLARGIAVQNADGKTYRMAGSQTDITERKQAEAQLARMLAEIEKSRDDLLSILNRLRVGSALTGDDGRITFVSESCQQILGRPSQQLVGVHWEKLWPLDPNELAQLVAMAERPPELRSKISARLDGRGNRSYWVEIEVQDDPRDAKRKIFFLYDMTEVRDLRRLLDEKAQYQDLVGKSEPMKQVYQQIRELAGVEATVLIEGETGTGKELVARAIHYSSNRRKSPFVAVNCAGLTESLLASQLFGHRRGAFTGAIDDHQGVFEAANGGTIFLDEIGDVSLSVQTSLLRVLQEREITRVGDSRPRKIDVRVITATNREHEKEVEKGAFRLDLLYRIRVVRLMLPPLRERREDIPLLVSAFLNKFRATTGKAVQEVSTDALRVLMENSWRGNVRELQSAVEFAVIRCKGSVIQPEDLPPEIVSSAERPLVPRGSVQDERQRIQEALATSRGNRTAAARLLGISRATFYRRLAELGMPADSSSPPAPPPQP